VAWYGVWHWPMEWNDKPAIAPSASVFVFTLGALFIGQALVAGGDHDRRFIAHYETHFDVAWKLGLQGLLSGVFVGIFWAVLELGAALFNLIGLSGFGHFIEHRWFAIPATTLAFAAAVHLTDVRAGLVRGTRTLVLVLLSWLLPLMAGIAAAFLLSLLFTGLAPLWKTNFAAGYLLFATAVLIFLINAAFQDGDAERLPASVLRLAGSVAAVLLVPLVAISAYAIDLRVAQYGWTEQRVFSAACLVVAAFYAVGYAVAAFPRGAWLARMARWNFYAALLVIAVIFAVFSPIADPLRIAVNSQVARLESGRVTPDAFDYSYLRNNSGRFGMHALHALAHYTGAHAEYIRAKAEAVLGTKPLVAPPAIPQDIAANFAVYPAGRTLPPSFIHQDWNHDPLSSSLPACMANPGVGCTAFFLDLFGDGREEIVVIGVDKAGVTTSSNGVFASDDKGVWHLIATPDNQWECKSNLEALRRGDFKLVPPPLASRDVEVRGTRLTVSRLAAPCSN
ncbi:MAG TPA: DUF4153 domain-containing protein, partial [Rhizomicrobium sp.]|nr:DUF4153 domain-containing protein [Rhizomicrobium sp.]